ncbi:hypothetical protein VM98_14345 [Streptomyces rubellomurinus subsp. indigoferus]|nr:hypothetical protein VM98_14345 [Streptomyces rubellomurinus subsp. indigoferus]
MTDQRGWRAPADADERRRREQEWAAGQKEREKAWNAEFEKRQAAGEAEAREQQRVTGTARERESWGGGRRSGSIGFVDVTGPDGQPVRIAVVWLGRFRATAGRLHAYEPMRNLDGGGGTGEGVLLLIPIALLVGLNFGLRWLVLALLRRPRWAVAAKAGSERGKAGGNTVLLRTRDRAEAYRYAAALADRVERDGSAALTPR